MNAELEPQGIPPLNSPSELKPGGPIFSHTPRLANEWKTVTAMIRCYCQGNHGTKGAMCPDCQSLLEYATTRLERCRFGKKKPTCAQCPVHCYQRAQRDQIKQVMRYAGPRMLWQHPLLCLRHLLL